MESLKSGKSIAPTGLVLIKTFVKQAEKPSSSAQGKREKLLNGLAAKVHHITLSFNFTSISLFTFHVSLFTFHFSLSNFKFKNFHFSLFFLRCATHSELHSTKSKKLYQQSTNVNCYRKWSLLKTLRIDLIH